MNMNDLEMEILTRLFFMATGERISNKSVHTGTLWGVIRNMALGAGAANARARIFTFIIHTSKMTWTIAICDTLRTTTAVWIANIIRQAFASACSFSFDAFCVCATWIGRTWMTNFIINNCWKNTFRYQRLIVFMCYGSGWKQKRLTVA